MAFCPSMATNVLCSLSLVMVLKEIDQPSQAAQTTKTVNRQPMKKGGRNRYIPRIRRMIDPANRRGLRSVAIFGSQIRIKLENKCK